MMTVIVTDSGFAADDFEGTFVALDDATTDTPAIEVPSNAEIRDLAARLSGASFVRILFPSFSDGRGFTLAAQLRREGFKGRLRAKGHVIADQYAMARRSGFDEVEISDDLAARQPEDQWLARAKWQAHDYQSRMRA